MTVHQIRRVPTFALGALSAVLVLGACGGGGSSKSAPPQSNSVGTDAATTSTASSPSSGNGNCYTTPGTQRAKVRFVNLFTNPTYPSSAIDVYQGYGADDPCGKKLASIPYGSASDYIDVTAGAQSGDWSATAYVAGSSDKDHQIISQGETWKGGEQVTIVFAGADRQAGADLPASSGSDQAFFESGGNDATLKSVPGKAVLGVAATSLQNVVKDGAWVAGLSGQSGCLKAAGDTESTTTDIGGTQLVQYTVDSGSLNLGLYNSDPGKCTGTPAIGPAAFDAAADSRTFVFAYGPDAQHLKLLVLPINS